MTTVVIPLVTLTGAYTHKVVVVIVVFKVNQRFWTDFLSFSRIIKQCEMRFKYSSELIQLPAMCIITLKIFTMIQSHGLSK